MKNELEKDNNNNEYNSKQIKEKELYNSIIKGLNFGAYENNLDNNKDEEINKNKDNKNSKSK